MLRVEKCAWNNVRYRCHNPDHKNYRNYGARGIKVCQRWLSFEAFLEDVGRRPGPEYSLERDDVNGDYEPGNVRWATRKEQANNTRRNHWHTCNGRTQTIAQWAEELGVPYKTAQMRVQRGFPVDHTRTPKGVSL